MQFTYTNIPLENTHSTNLRPRLDRILDLCIENGIELGWNRAHKHTDNPQDDAIKAEIAQAIWAELDEYFDFER
jgi:hypothetical protein